MTLLLIAAAGAHADNAWETHIEGHGTLFEKRWANAVPLTDESSDDTSLGYAGINVVRGDLSLYVNHPDPEIATMLSLLSGEEFDCSYDNWRLAVDRKEFKIADTSESTDNSATFMQPQDDEAFWDEFEAGSLLAVQVERTCDGDMDVATMVYSLAGAKATIEYVLNKVPTLAPESAEKDGARQASDSNEIAAYQFAIAQKIQRSWAMPASVTEDTECVVAVRQTRTGDVINANIVSCNGNDAVRRSVEAAVMRASPLPEPSSPDLFHPELRIVLRPDL